MTKYRNNKNEAKKKNSKKNAKCINAFFWEFGKNAKCKNAFFWNWWKKRLWQKRLFLENAKKRQSWKRQILKVSKKTPKKNAFLTTIAHSELLKKISSEDNIIWHIPKTKLSFEENNKIKDPYISVN